MYVLYAGYTESYKYTLDENPKKALLRIRSILGIKRVDLYKIRKIKTSPGYPKSASHYQVVKRTRVGGVKKETVCIQSFLVIKE